MADEEKKDEEKHLPSVGRQRDVIEYDDDIAYFARTNFRNQQRKFGIKRDDRRRHMYFIGKTGMGKSTVLENMIAEDIMADNGIAVVDPHGDMAEKLINFVPAHRINDVVYFNPADIEHPIAFNVLESVDESYRHLVASGLIQVFKKLWADSWGPRLEYILMNAILALIDYPGSTLLGVTRILVDKQYRRKVVAKITDPVVKTFWIDEYDNYNERFRNEAIAPIQNKVGQFLSSVIIRNIVGQPKSTIDMREIMDNKKILIMNLSKGRVGEDNSALLGAMMITKLQLAAMSRVDIPEEQRQDFYLYVDEFQNFATESFASILSEARKYRLNLIIAHQYIEQLDETVRSAVFGNVGTLIVFRIGAEDSEFVAKEFMPTFTEEDLVNLTKYDVYLKLMIDGVSSAPFSATTLPPVEFTGGDPEKVIRVSRERYAKSRTVVEEKIMRWSGVDEIHKGSAEVEDDRTERERSPRVLQGSRNTAPRAPREDRQPSSEQPRREQSRRSDQQQQHERKPERREKQERQFRPIGQGAPVLLNEGSSREGISLKDVLGSGTVLFKGGTRKQKENLQSKPDERKERSSDAVTPEQRQRRERDAQAFRNRQKRPSSEQGANRQSPPRQSRPAPQEQPDEQSHRDQPIGQSTHTPQPHTQTVRPGQVVHLNP